MRSAAARSLPAADRRPREEGLRFLGPLALARGRVHEIAGPARRTLALIVAAAAEGEVFWITPAWGVERLNGDGIAELIDPARLVFVSPRQGRDLLWCTEETLRSGAVPLVLADLAEPPALTPIRRLHLAAEAGGRRGAPPLGLVLTPEGAAPGAESRWHFAQSDDGWRLERQKARGAPPRTWHVGSGRPFMPAEPAAAQRQPRAGATCVRTASITWAL